MQFERPEAPGHIDYTVLAEQIKEPRLIDSDRALFEAFIDQPLSDDEFAQLDQHYQRAIMQLPSGPAALRPEALTIKNHRRLFFGHAKMEESGHKLHKALRLAISPTGTYPNPSYFIGNGRLFQALGANTAETFISDAKLLAYPIDLQSLGEKDEILRAHGLSLGESPGLLLSKTQLLREALPSIARNLAILGLPLTVGDVLGKRPGIARQNGHKLHIMTLLASRHGDLRSHLRSQRGREGSVRAKLLGDIAIAAILPIEGSLIKVGESREFSLPAIRYFVNKNKDSKQRRNYLLELLGRHDPAIENIGQDVLRLYFALHPLTTEEHEAHPNLAPFKIGPQEVTLDDAAGKASPRKRNRGARGPTYGSEKWLPELAQRIMEGEEHLEVLAAFQAYIAERQEANTAEASERERQLGLAFYDKLGWLSPDHPLYEAFEYSRGPDGAHLPSPTKVVELARLLASQPKGTTIMVLNVALRLTDWTQLPPFEQKAPDAQPPVSEPVAKPEKSVRSRAPSTTTSDPEISVFDTKDSPADTVASVKKCLGLDELRSARPTSIPSEKLPAYESLVESLDRDHTLEDILTVPGIEKLPEGNLSQIAAEAKQLIENGDEPTLRWLIQRIAQEKDWHS